MEPTLETQLDFKEKLFDLIKSEEMAYYYHVTESDKEDIIFNEGLLMKEQNLATKMIPIDEEILNDPISFVLDEANRGFNRTIGSIILIGILKEDLPYAAKINKNASAATDYIFTLEPEYIIGSIDIETLRITLNENYLLASDIDYNSSISLY